MVLNNSWYLMSIIFAAIVKLFLIIINIQVLDYLLDKGHRF